MLKIFYLTSSVTTSVTSSDSSWSSAISSSRSLRPSCSCSYFGPCFGSYSYSYLHTLLLLVRPVKLYPLLPRKPRQVFQQEPDHLGSTVEDGGLGAAPAYLNKIGAGVGIEAAVESWSWVGSRVGARVGAVSNLILLPRTLPILQQLLHRPQLRPSHESHQQGAAAQAVLAWYYCSCSYVYFCSWNCLYS